VPGERGVTIRVRGSLMFESGSDKLRLPAEALLYQISDLAKSFDYNIAVEGHTDAQPISSDRFPTNWHLSAYRAIVGLQFLAGPGEIEVRRLSATGFGSTRPIVTPEDSEDARNENRRLEFVFYRPDTESSHGEVDREAAQEMKLPGFDL